MNLMMAFYFFHRFFKIVTFLSDSMFCTAMKKQRKHLAMKKSCSGVFTVSFENIQSTDVLKIFSLLIKFLMLTLNK